MNQIKEILYVNKIKILFILLILFIISTSILLYFFFNNNINDELTAQDQTEKNIETRDDILEIKKYFVDIKGEVNKVGVYGIEENKRVIDVIKAAGGLTKNADTKSINLSKKVEDEMVIIIHSKSEIKNFSKTKEVENKLNVECNKTTIIKNDSCISSDDVLNENIKISINNATLEELITIPNIGDAKAKAIIEYRNQNGNFKTIEDIMNVSGIGNALFEKIKDNITI